MNEPDREKLWAWAHKTFGTRARNTGDPEMDRDEHAGTCPGCTAYHVVLKFNLDAPIGG